VKTLIVYCTVKNVVLVSERNLHSKISILLLGLITLLVGCTGTPSPTPTNVAIAPTETPNFVVVTGEGVRPTLPPAWTPTDTPTSVPPTLTPSITPTFTPSPTFTVDEMCTHFTVVNTPRSGRPYLTGAIVPFMYYAEFPDALIRIYIVNEETGEDIEGSYPSAVSIATQFPMDVEGTYEWTIGLVTQTYGEICQQTGTFTVVTPPDQTGGDVPSTASATAEATESESTQEALAICDIFTVEPDFVEGQVFDQTESVNVTLNADASEVFIRFVVTRRDTNQRQTVQVPGGIPFTLNLPARLLYGAGVYDWSATIYNDQIGQQCEQSGSFAVVESGGPTPTFELITATATPTATEVVVTTDEPVTEVSPAAPNFDLTSTAVATFFVMTATPTVLVTETPPRCAVLPARVTSTATSTATATVSATPCATVTPTPRPSATRRPTSTPRTPTATPTP
jgi:hypothetical protein